jgi:hypothetical protein
MRRLFLHFHLPERDPEIRRNQSMTLILAIRIEATEKDVGSEDAQVADHRESHEGIAVDSSQPMNSDSE